jgi:MFS family permease
MSNTIVRDRFTWLTYLMLGYYAYLLNGLGPVMPFLRAELGMSYTLSSLHFSAFAVGMLFAGLASDRIARRFGRRFTFWAGAFGMAGGVLLLLTGFHPIMTIGGTFVMGTVGSLLLVMIPAMLSDRYGAQRAVAISESNVVASLCGGFAPIAIGFFVRIHLGWRGALVVIILAAFFLRLMFRQVSFPEPEAFQTFTRVNPVRERNPDRVAPVKLPGLYWVYWNMLVLAVSVEFCIIFWSAAFLEAERGLPRADAAFVMSVFLGAMVVGRLIGSRLSQRMQSGEIVLVSVGISLVGFLIHWWATPLVLTMSGLFLAGLGVANLYPQILSLVVGTAPGQTDRASARASLASGIAILCLPLLLGGLADRIGLWYAYGLVVILLVCVGVGNLIINQQLSWKRRHAMT